MYIMDVEFWIYVIATLATMHIINFCDATELTFELPDSARECFHQEIRKNTSVTLEFQVICKDDFFMHYSIIGRFLGCNRWAI